MAACICKFSRTKGFWVFASLIFYLPKDARRPCRASCAKAGPLRCQQKRTGHCYVDLNKFFIVVIRLGE
jgi:hypothetical protein